MIVDTATSLGFRAHGVSNVAINVDLALPEGSPARYMAVAFIGDVQADVAFGTCPEEAVNSLYERHLRFLARDPRRPLAAELER